MADRGTSLDRFPKHPARKNEGKCNANASTCVLYPHSGGTYDLRELFPGLTTSNPDPNAHSTLAISSRPFSATEFFFPLHANGREGSKQSVVCRSTSSFPNVSVCPPFRPPLILFSFLSARIALGFFRSISMNQQEVARFHEILDSESGRV